MPLDGTALYVDIARVELRLETKAKGADKTRGGR
jgi:hypothetical protein